ncbi:DUF6731 family protein [Bacillus sp. JJ864]|uniref:DUF6731 family protein n=1 Tax=Bacillus sp. JJ864 TaxID=3122975 RepID=UPI002FFFF172
MTVKRVRFNYFTINLVPDVIPPNMQGRNLEAPWDMTTLLDYLSVMQNPLDCVVNVREYIAEFDRHTIIYDERARVYSFQIGKLRENDIPPKKRIGDPKEDLILQDDEYIGEFVTIVFDPTFCTVAVQSNLYSLNISQVEIFLTELRNRYKQLIGEVDQIPLNVELHPIVDTAKVDTIGNADIFRKINIKGSNIMADAMAQNGTLGEVSEIIGRANGINFELTISLGTAPKAESLDSELIQEIIDGFSQLGDENKPKIEITAREDIESPVEVVNLLTPRLTNVIDLHLENRTGIGHEYIHIEFMEKYHAKRTAIARILQPLAD